MRLINDGWLILSLFFNFPWHGYLHFFLVITLIHTFCCPYPLLYPFIFVSFIIIIVHAFSSYIPPRHRCSYSPSLSHLFILFSYSLCFLYPFSLFICLSLCSLIYSHASSKLLFILIIHIFLTFSLFLSFSFFFLFFSPLSFSPTFSLLFFLFLPFPLLQAKSNYLHMNLQNTLHQDQLKDSSKFPYKTPAHSLAGVEHANQLPVVSADTGGPFQHGALSPPCWQQAGQRLCRCYH